MSNFNDPQAAYKLWICFKDGNKRNFLSRDFINKQAARNPELGRRRLLKYAAKISASTKTMVLYDRHTNQAVKTWIEGVEQANN